MASTNSNKGRAVVLSAACVTMFFISSIALYSVVSKNLLAVYPEWSSALTWAFPVFQTIMAVTGIFAGRISDKIGPRNVVIAAAVCYGLGWFMSGTVTEPWQFYLWFSLVAAIGNGLGYNPALTTGQKWFIDKKGLASGITLAASTAGPAVLSPVLASLLIPSLGIFGALKALGGLHRINVKKHRHIRLQCPLHEFFKGLDNSGIDALTSHLIGVGRIRKTVGEYPVAPGKSRFNDLGDMFGARREKKQGFG